jgi:hypothetical protein
MSGTSDRVIIAVHRDDVKRFGANTAIVLQQIRHYLDGVRDEWYEQTSDELGRLCGLSPDQVRRSVKRLIDAGVLESARRHAHRGDQTLSFRIISPGDSATSEMAIPPDVGDGDSATSTSSLEKTKTPPTPPWGGDHQPGLFGTEPPADPKPAKVPTSATFERFWESYPSGNRGVKSKAAAKFESLTRKGVTAAALEARLAHYTAARTLAARTYGGEAPVMHASRFLHQDHANWVTPVTGPDDERVTYWAYACQQAATTDATGGTPMTAEMSYQIAMTTLNRLGKTLIDPTDQWNATLAALADTPAIQETLKRVGWDAIMGWGETGPRAWKAAWAAQPVGAVA